MGAAALALQATGAAQGAIGSYYGARAQKAQLGAEADIADINARLSEQQAQQALAAGQKQSQQSKMQTAQLKSTQRAQMAAGGVVLGEGSAGAIEAGTDVMGQIDANTIEANAIQSAWGYRGQAVQQQSEARMKRASAKAIKPGLTAATSLLGGAGQVAGTYYSMQKSGAVK